MAMGARIAMSISQHRIMAWLSPSFPTGAFAYSHGLEYAVHIREIHDADSLHSWLLTILEQGAAWNDALLLAAAYRGEAVGELASALAGSKERHQETWDQGRAFARTARQLLKLDIEAAPLPVVLGKAAKSAEIELADFVPMVLHSFVGNLVSAAIRLVPLGQTDGQIVLERLFDKIDEISMRALGADLSQLANSALGAEIAAMRHETMATRIFRT